MRPGTHTHGSELAHHGCTTEVALLSKTEVYRLADAGESATFD